MKRIKLKKIVLIFIAIVLFITLSCSIINIIKWKLDSNKIDEQVDKIKKDITVAKVKDNKDTVIIDQKDTISKSNPYWDYIKMDMIDVNFDKLKSINEDVKGWIKLNGTNINYPFVQASDNKYYLTHSFDKKKNSAGWVFLDYRNNGINNKNTIIYAHGRTDKTMFGSLKSVLSKKWQSNNNNHIIKISTENENTLWQIFSVYRIPTTSDYLQTSFNNDDEYQKFLNMLLNRSSYNFNSFVSADDIILTLSTCYNDNDKIVVHAKLIKKMKK